jgi:hypothetical protein
MNNDKITVGAWVRNATGDIVKVLSVGEHTLVYKSDKEGIYGAKVLLTSCEGVKLNDSLLERNGFTKSEDTGLWEYDNREDTDDGIGFQLGKIANGYVFFANFRTIFIEYVHELQTALKFCGVKLDFRVD